MKGGLVIVEEEFVYEKETHLTVMKTSLFFPGDGFIVYESTGQVVFRVDSYGPDARDSGELVLMDPSGRCLLTVRRKRPSLHQRWEGFLGERTEGDKPIFSVRRSSIIGRSNMTVELFGDKTVEYQIEGNFGNRSCTIYDSGKETMAEIRRKVDASTNMMLGKDVFSLTLKPGFDGAFAMGLVLVLDQISGDDDADGYDGAVDQDPTTIVDCSISTQFPASANAGLEKEESFPKDSLEPKQTGRVLAFTTGEQEVDSDKILPATQDCRDPLISGNTSLRLEGTSTGIGAIKGNENG